MACIIKNFEVINDNNDRVRKAIIAATPIEPLRQLLAGDYNSGRFAKWFAANVKDVKFKIDEFTDQHGNTVKSLIRRYMMSTYPAVEHTSTANQDSQKGLFRSISAKTTALTYCGYHLGVFFNDYFNLPQEEKEKQSIRSYVYDKLFSHINRQFVALIDEYFEDNQDNKSYEDYKKNKDIVNDYINTLADKKKELLQLKGAAKTNKKVSLTYFKDKTYEEGYAQVKKEQKAARDAVEAIKALAIKEFKEDYSAEKYYNFSALYQEIQKYNSDKQATDFITELDAHKSVFNFARELQENEKATENPEEDEYGGEDALSEEDRDMIAADFDNYVYKTYLNLFDADVRSYISNLLKLNSPYGSALSYDTNNELGVALPVNERRIITQIVNFANFYSLPDFIETLKNLATKNKDLYSIAPLIDKMEADDVFARKVFVNFARPVVNKAVVAVNRFGSVDFIQSNEQANALSQIYFDLLNNIKLTYNIEYDDYDVEEIFFDANHRLEFCKRIIKSFFPDLDANTVDKVLTDKFNPNDNTDTSELAAISANLKNLLQEVQKVFESKKKVDDAYKEGMDAYNDYTEALKQWEQSGDDYGKPKKVEVPTYESEKISFDGLTPYIIKIAELFVPYVSVNTELNNVTPTGTKSSNLIKNSAITNFFKQLQMVVNGDENAGTRILLDFFTKSRALEDNPILFGITDEKGKTIYEGIFKKDDAGNITINENAKNIINYCLFEGIANRSEFEGVEYRNMNQRDYIISSILAYNSPVNFNHSITNKENVSKLCNILMRIPSDASNQFAVQIQKHLYQGVNGLFGKDDVVNRNSSMFRALRQHIIGEIKGFGRELRIVTDYNNQTGEFTVKQSTDGLADFYNIKNGKIVDDEGNLVGNAFKIFKLFKVGDYDASKELASLLYGGTPIVKKDGTINTDKISGSFFYNQLTDTFELSRNFNYEALDNIIETWVKKYNDYVKNQFEEKYASIFDKVDNEKLNKTIAAEAIFNQTLAYMAFDDMFEGNAKYYKDAQTFLKRAKEVQMSGSSIFAYDFTAKMNEGISELTDSTGKAIEVTYKSSDGTRQTLKINNESVMLTNGFRAVTINNTKRGSTSAQKIFDETYDKIVESFKASGASTEAAQTVANNIAMGVAKGFGDFKTKDGQTIVGDKTKINDAQSYITLQEFVRRRYANGTLDEYGDLIEQLLDPDVDISKLDTEKLNKFIQVEKNVYYDLEYDNYLKDYRPRQIKNAEFVLIPALLPEGSDLRKLYDIMIRRNIQQVNTLETSKASNKTVLDFWDASDETKINEDFESQLKKYDASIVENYYYRNLHKQQDMVDHMEDKTNKAGIQIMKKILDNLTERTKAYGDAIQDAFTANIKDSYNKLLFSFGWKKNENGVIVNIKDGSYVLDFSEFYSRAREEAQRLGMDSNFIDYLTPNDAGNVEMPNYLGTVAKKIESIAQSIFTNKIARQTLPGWHAVQASSVGYDNNLEYHPNKYINKTNYNDIITAEEYEKLEDKNNYIKAEFVDCMLPVWDSKIEKAIKHKMDAEGLTRKAAEDKVLEELNSELLSLQVGYRIPTEGKQSTAIFRIKGFVSRVYGSTIFVSGDWVAQTGSDMDYDTIYGIVHHMTIDEDFHIKKVVMDNSKEEDAIKKRYCRYINEFIEDKRVQTKDYVRQAKSVKQNLYEEIDELEKKKDKADVYFKGMQEVAKSAGLISYKEFKELPLIEQQTRQVRDNVILDNMIAILNNSDSLEEIYSRSNFDDIVDEMDRLNKLSGNTFDSASVYNPFDQFRFMQNAIDGRKLKAFSVNRDTFNSINNRIHTLLNGNHAITVEYDLNLKDKKGNVIYDKNIIEAAFGKNNCKTEGNIIIVTHRKLGWSDNNRNVVGKILTAYSSQTTAHILDAIKSGAIFNETDYTFGTFKTLIDVGIDYRTAISFLMQPTITNLNFHYESANSVYKKEFNNPIQAVLFDIAKQIKPDIEKGITEKELTDIILNDENIKNQFKEVWGVELNKNIYNTAINLNNAIFENRFKEENLAVDLGVLILFNKLNRTTKNIEALSRCANPDSFGAKQTIHDTRRIIDNVLAYNHYKSTVGKTLVVGKYDSLYNFIEPTANESDGKYTTFLEALYPGFGVKTKNGAISYDINIEHSGYKSLAAIFNYCTRASVQLNQRVFDFESDEINNFILGVEDKIGRNFNDKEYTVFKQFMLSNIYKKVSVIAKPITINAHKQFALDDEKITKDNYWVTEENRIFGHVETLASVSISDINNPTAQELRDYCKLTPLQKIMFIKNNFTFGKGIFDHIHGTRYNKNELQRQGFSKNRLTVSLDGLDVEELFKQFNESFFNSNPLIKLAALDLIKYAFLVEGFNFARNSISRIITNKALTADLSASGTNIIQEIREIVANIKNDEMFKDFKDKVAKNFVRSHKFVAYTRRFSKDSKFNELFKKLIDVNEKGFVVINATKDTANLIEYLKLSGNRPIKFINIGYYGAKNKDYQKYYETLYELQLATDDEGNIKKVVLIPLNLLEPSEYRDYSLNNDNNKHYSYEYYLSEVLKLPDINYDEGFKVIPYYKFLRLSKTNPNRLMEMLSDNAYSKWTRDKIEGVYNRIVDHFSSQSTADNPIVFSTNLKEIKGLFDEGKDSVRQIIKLKDGTEKTIVIKKRSRAISNMLKYHFNKSNRKVTKRIADFIKEQEQDILWNDDTEQKIALYSATILDEEVNINAKEHNTVDTIEEEVLGSRISYSSTIPSTGGKTSSYENVANLIAKDIEYKAHHNDEVADSILHEFINKGISISTLMDISARTNDIYVLSSKYYDYASNMLSEKLTNYNIDGVDYSLNPYETVDGKSLYDALREHPEERDKFFRMVIEAKTFGDTIKDLLRLPVEGREPFVDKAINSIKKSIERVRNNNNLKLAFDAIFDYYLAKEYSENPNVRYGYVKLTNIYNDVNWWDAQLSDVAELDHKQIQVIVKMASEIIARAHFEGLDKVKEFKKYLADLLKEEGDFAWEHIITEQGKFVRTLDDKFFKDKEEKVQKVRDAIDRYGYNSLEYLKAKLERDEWFYEHTYQELKDDYYKEDLANRRRVLEKAPQDYVRYLQLKEKIYTNYIPYSMMNAEQKAERNRIWEEINKLRGKYVDFDENTPEDIESLWKTPTNYLEEFIVANRNLKNKYFHTTANKDFAEILRRHLDFIDTYDAKHPDKTLNQKLEESEDYKEAYDWVKENTIRKLDKAVAAKIDKAFAVLNKVNDYANKALKAQINKVPTEERYDAYGIIDGTKYTDEQQKKIRELTLKKFYPYGEFKDGELVKNTINENFDSKYSDTGLLKETDDRLGYITFNDLFYKEAFNGGKAIDDKELNTRHEIYSQINAITIHGFENGTFSINRLYDYYKSIDSLETLDKLAELYQQLRELNKVVGKFKDKDEKFKVQRNTIAFDRNMNEVNSRSSRILNILCDRNKDGEYITDDDGNLVANRFLFGYYAPLKEDGTFDDTYIDHTKTDAKKIIYDYVSYEETQHLADALKEAERNGILEEFKQRNQVYNPYTHRNEWTSIWTTMTVSPAITDGALYSFEPQERYSRREINNGVDYDHNLIGVVEDARNENYKRGEINWRKEDDTYANDNYKKLSKKEQNVVEYLQKIVNIYAKNYNHKKFAMQGYIPRMPTINTDAKWYAKEIASTLGVMPRNYSDREWHDIIDFTHDFDAKFNLFDFIKGKGSRDLIKIKPKTFETDEQYKAYVADVRKQNEEIQKENLRIDNELLNRNYESVFEQLIYNGEDYTARQNCKDLIYLMIEDLKSRKATKVNNFGKLSRNIKLSSEDNEVYNTTGQSNALLVFQNWARRILFEEYKQLSPATRYADALQNLTTVKFMMLNVLGGIANVGTGLVNILGEGFARDFFSAKEFNAQSLIYSKKVLKMINAFFTDKVDDKYVAITKYFDVVDFDAMLYLAKQDSAVEANKKINELLYSFLSGGEHYMQNTVLFALLENHRLYKNDKGEYEAINLNEYKADIDIEAFEHTLSQKYPDLVDSYKLFVSSAISDKNIQRNYDRFQSNPINDFIRSISDKKLRVELAKEYNNNRKAYAKTAEAEFNQLPTVMSQLEFKDGELEFVKDAETEKPILNNKIMAHIKYKAQQVNKKIHGVYDKIGGARIEQYWWGNLVTQYHKHIYPGIMKRYRMNGFFNETRGAVDFGSYVSAFKLSLNTIKDVANDSKKYKTENLDTLAEDNEIDALRSIGTFMTNVFQLHNYFAFEWNLLPTWEKQNIYRCLGDACGIGSALLASFAIYLAVDDDDLKDNNFVNSCLYLADRLHSESNMYTPMGLYSEASTFWRSPVAGFNTIKDLFKCIELTNKYILDPSFSVTYESGMYKGQNKYKVVIERNIPVYRMYKRFDNMAKNNSYYRINESTLDKRLMKTIAEEITEED